MNRALIFILAFCLIVSMASFYVAAVNGDSSAYPLSVISFVAFFGLYAVVVLWLKLGGNHISLESKVQNLETESTELKESVEALLKAIYLLSSPRGPAAGPSRQQIELLDKYLSPIKHLTPTNIRKLVDEEIKTAHANGMRVHPDYHRPKST